MEPVTAPGVAKLASIAPQFLVDDLQRSVDYYCQRLGFELDFSYEALYASVSRDGCAIHLKAAPKTEADRAHRKQQQVAFDAENLQRNLRLVGGKCFKRWKIWVRYDGSIAYDQRNRSNEGAQPEQDVEPPAGKHG